VDIDRSMPTASYLWLSVNLGIFFTYLSYLEQHLQKYADIVNNIQFQKIFDFLLLFILNFSFIKDTEWV